MIPISVVTDCALHSHWSIRCTSSKIVSEMAFFLETLTMFPDAYRGGASDLKIVFESPNQDL